MRLSAMFTAAATVLTVAAPTAQPQTIRQYQLEREGNGYRLALKTVPRPTPGQGQVLVRVRAVSLNQRDLLVLRAQYGPQGGADTSGRIPLSDGAGEVVQVGPGVTRFRAGDRVAGTFFARWVDGKRSADAMP